MIVLFYFPIVLSFLWGGYLILDILGEETWEYINELAMLFRVSIGFTNFFIFFKMYGFISV